MPTHTAGMAPVLQELFAGMGTGGETWSGVMTQYCQGVAAGSTTCPAGSAHVGFSTAGVLSGVWEDTSVVSPSQATQAQLATEAQAAATHFGNTTATANRNVQYLVVSPPGTHPDGFNTATGTFCAWHDYTGDASLGTVSQPNGPAAFTNLPYLPDMGASCGQSFVNAGSAGALDGVTIVEGHEYAETVTDQFPSGGWWDSSGSENGDKCAWIAPGSAGGAQDVTMATGTFAMQATWGNDGASGAGACEIAHPFMGNSVVTVTTPPAQTTTAGSPASLVLTATDSATGQTLAWSASGLPAGLAIDPASGTISGTPTSPVWQAPVTVTAADGLGGSGTASFSWTVASPTGNTVTVSAPATASATTGTPITPVVPSASDTQARQVVTWSASGLPAGLAVNVGTGAVTGTPSAPGVSTATLTATDATGAAGSATVTWTVSNTVTVANPGPRTSPPGAAIAPLQLVATDSAVGQTLTWSATGLPAGLALDPASGVVSGTPAAAGTSTVTVVATDATGAAGSATFTWTVANTVTVTVPATRSDVSGAAIAPLVPAGTDSSPGQTLTWSATGLPAGLALDPATGTVSGTPTAACSCRVTLVATDTTGAAGSALIAWTVTNRVAVQNASSRTSTTGSAIAPVTLTATDSSATATITSWSATGLPAGIALGASTGTLSGTPTTPGTATVTVTAVDSAGSSGSATFTWTVANTVTVAARSAQSGTTGTAITTLTNSATDSQSGQTFTWSATGLPAGLAISASTGSVTGTPTAPCACSVTVKATDKSGASGTTSFAWTVVNKVTVTSVSSQSSTSGKSVTAVTVKATDSQSGQTFTWAATGLPSGLTIGSSTGTISGTPTAACSCSVTVTATDTSGAKGSTTFTWKVVNTVTVTNPGAQTTAVNTSVSLQLAASDSAAGQTLTWSATGLPSGLTISSSSGLISGKPTKAATSTVTVKATDTSGASGSTTFSWTTK